ncbi:ABC transporter ATP-binding protein [Kocuria sp. WRN011]|uniref:ABC transporter ATP-binding protein n=1 Tax=Kocuria TaxID=57493 RepID=UPI000BAF82AE|nr:ATP-binding cassette domain-containing protein [Kocuria sp. WRN011]PBB07963.1 ABC transporter ATP-binding protein [Kocuria sp. WRN011]PZP36370.1 MAG: ABC transporter ATP-binding protein [Kocuria rhizophila]
MRLKEPGAAYSSVHYSPPRAGGTLEALDLTRRFGDRTVVDEVSFRVEPGQMTGFVGANGAGKTTTMRMIMGVLNQHGGTVLWNGRPIDARARSRFGYMPEERGLYPKQRIADQLGYLGQLHGMERSRALTEAHRLLDRFGLGERAKDRLETLSLGNQQRVQVAAALLHDPVALVLDEPFSGLDPTAVDAMVGLLREYMARGVPVLFSSHQLDLIDRLCDALVVLDSGTVRLAGPVEQLRGARPEQYRLVCTADAGWTRGQPGVEVVDLDGNTAIVTPADAEARNQLTRQAADRGMVEFARLRPSLGDLYREAIS